MTARVVRLTGPSAETELVADRLLAQGASAVIEEDLGDGTVRLTSDVDPGESLPPAWRAETLDADPSAVDGWRPYARGVRAGARTVVQLPWAERLPVSRTDVVVEIDPGRAFGTGSHPSTRSALGVLERLVRPGARVLDVGCGSGVLSVAAALHGAGEVLAVDLDAEAVLATVANARRNGVDRAVTASRQPVEEVAGRFDIVVANISAAPLAELAPALSARLAAAGHLVLAGFLAVDSAVVRGAFSELDPEELVEEDGWAALVLRRGALSAAPG